MNRLRTLTRDFLQTWWQELLAIALFAACLIKVWIGHSWMLDLKPFLLALLGLVSFLASDEVAMATGDYGWIRSEWREYPAEWVKWGGALLLLGSAVRLLAI